MSNDEEMSSEESRPPDVDAEGVAIICDLAGNIREYIRDELGLGERVAVGRPVSTIVDPASIGKMLGFLSSIRAQGAAFGWELNIQVRGQLRPFYFAGGTLAETLLVVASNTRTSAARYYDELMAINNEQANALRAVMKEQQLYARAQADRDSHLYDEMMRLNNELTNLQRELTKKNIELERLNAQKNQFIGMAAHDLRNPLNAVLIYSQFLISEAAAALDKDQVDMLVSIEQTTRFMYGIVNDLLDIYRIDAGRLDLNLELTDLVALVERNIAINRLLAEQQQKRLEFRQAGELPRLRLDANKIVQVLNNLISNALKFSYPGSGVEVSVTHEGDRAVLAVRDEGQGIPAEELGNLFKPFGRTSVQSLDGQRSTGLGLAIVKNIVTGHGGEIRVASEVGKGTTFFVSLPIHYQ